MSEHPELREALAAEIGHPLSPLAPYQAAQIADALLAGPVGKLQAELAEALETIDLLREELTIAGRGNSSSAVAAARALADPERIRREAIGAWVLAHESQRHAFWPIADALAAGESAVTGEAT